MKRNGVRQGITEIAESFSIRKLRGSDYRVPTEFELARMKKLSRELSYCPLISVIVPVYMPDSVHYRLMIESVAEQSYDNLELILADASPDEDASGFRMIADSFEDARIKYLKMEENGGISANTNVALEAAKGEYIALLDHDDELTPDALLRVVEKIISFKKDSGKLPDVIYSDEDKLTTSGDEYTERNSKPDFDPNLLLCCNYICHLTVVRADLLKKLGFRSEFDGSQDYDMLLRAYREGAVFCHIPQVLYHWRITPVSTSSNTSGKSYAYDAGKRALEEHASALGWDAEIYNLRNVGYYEFRYSGDLLKKRQQVGAVGGRVVSNAHRGKILGGIMDREGNPIYAGLPSGYTGYFHRAALQQSAPVLDIRCIRISERFYNDFYRITGIKYSEHRTPGIISLRPHEITRAPQDGEKVFDFKSKEFTEDEILKMSLELSKVICDAGYELLYYPTWQVAWK